MKYRDHRGGYKESMETVQEVKSVQDIKNHLVSIYGEIQDIRFEHVLVDDRNGWDTYYVLMSPDGENYHPIGMTDGIPKGGKKMIELDELLKDLIGLTEKKARVLCNISRFSHRVVRSDKNAYVITHDLNMFRVNIELDNGIVTKTYLG